MKYIPLVSNLLVVGLICVILNFLLANHSIVDDGVFYKEAFDTISYRTLVGGYRMFQLILGASEFLSYGIFYLFSQICEYENFIFISNLVFSILIFLVYKKFNRNLLHFALTIPLNFYFLVLCFGAQRLKFGIMFMLLAVLCSGKKAKIIFVMCSFLSHFQMSIIFFAERVGASFKSMSAKKLFGLGVFAVILAGAILSNSELQTKIVSYTSGGASANFIPFLTCAFLSVHFSKYNVTMIAQFVVYFFLILIIGETRINIFAFFVMWNQLFLKGEKPELISYAISFYLAVKGIIYIVAIYHGETGFPIPVN